MGKGGEGRRKRLGLAGALRALDAVLVGDPRAPRPPGDLPSHLPPDVGHRGTERGAALAQAIFGVRVGEDVVDPNVELERALLTAQREVPGAPRPPGIRALLKLLRAGSGDAADPPPSDDPALDGWTRALVAVVGPRRRLLGEFATEEAAGRAWDKERAAVLARRDVYSARALPPPRTFRAGVGGRARPRGSTTRQPASSPHCRRSVASRPSSPG